MQQSHVSIIFSSGCFFLYVLASAAPTDVAAGLDCVMQSGEEAHHGWMSRQKKRKKNVPSMSLPTIFL